MGGLAGLIHCFELQDGANFSKGGEWPHHGNKVDWFLELVTEADEEGVNKRPIFNVTTKLLEFITDGPVLANIFGNGLHDIDSRFRMHIRVP
jgi:hypothetical protein